MAHARSHGGCAALARSCSHGSLCFTWVHAPGPLTSQPPLSACRYTPQQLAWRLRRLAFHEEGRLDSVAAWRSLRERPQASASRQRGRSLRPASQCYSVLATQRLPMRQPLPSSAEQTARASVAAPPQSSSTSRLSPRCAPRRALCSAASCSRPRVGFMCSCAALVRCPRP